uniref:Death associated protein n=1 Tax=Callithrix jacchus TaxID=9483 RepID=A0A2R8MRQ5_CALJA
MSSPPEGKLETKAGHPPAVKAGGMRIVQKHPHTGDTKEEKDKDDQEWESPRVTKTFPRRLRRWLTRSRMPPWTSILPREPSTSSSHASEPGPHQPPPQPQLCCTWHFPERENQHFLPNSPLLGNLRQNEVLCPLPYISIFKARDGSSPNLVGESGWMSFEDYCAPRGAISRTCQDLRKTVALVLFQQSPDSLVCGLQNKKAQI